jgi:hypothetical protein
MGARKAAMWDEAKDKLKQSGMALSGGQQQRLCIARAVAVKPRSAARRADLRARSHFDGEDRGADHRAQGRLHDRASSPTTCSRRRVFGLHGLHVPGRADRIRRDRPDLPQARRKETEDYITGGSADFPEPVKDRT